MRTDPHPVGVAAGEVSAEHRLAMRFLAIAAALNLIAATAAATETLGPDPGQI